MKYLLPDNILPEEKHQIATDEITAEHADAIKHGIAIDMQVAEQKQEEWFHDLMKNPSKYGTPVVSLNERLQKCVDDLTKRIPYPPSPVYRRPKVALIVENYYKGMLYKGWEDVKTIGWDVDTNTLKINKTVSKSLLPGWIERPERPD